MESQYIENIEILDDVILGWEPPQIYAFSTNTVPNYIKIGDTNRAVNTRLNEWKRIFPDLNKVYETDAIVSDSVYFRDYSVHHYLEHDLGKYRLKKTDLDTLGIDDETKYSNEFFLRTSNSDIDLAVNDIKDNYNINSNKYLYYSFDDRLQQSYMYTREEDWKLRPDQQEVVENFKEAYKNGRNNLLMFAVMRFGKSFTALSCALEMDAKIVLVVSGKADVKEEWKKNVEVPGNFKDYMFLSSEDLNKDSSIIKTTIENDKKVVVFLTLQDLQGDEIKEKHKEIFESEIDLLIIDETHFGARAESFGAVLRASNSGYLVDDQVNVSALEDDSVEVQQVNEQVKFLNSKVRLHLSGTPYRILMGSEFEKEDIISFVQFTDIVKKQEAWDEKCLPCDDVNEWNNPYYGFPQMIRFAFNPNQSSVRKMKELKELGVNLTFSALFEPYSIHEDPQDNLHKKFKHEEEILDLLKVIDGVKEDENLFSFLDYDRIKDGNMCRHMVMVLPYCASCDAMEQLILENNEVFKNLSEYEIVNISGVEGADRYKTTNDVKTAIRQFEKEGKKTLTLTVNRMLTGSTVAEWDTMLYFKDTSSPQEYDQAIFRLQNQHVRTLHNNDEDNEEANKQIIKENMKPQTLLIDFNPHRLFVMQEQKSLIYNVNTEENGNSKLKERIEEELRISPIITMNKNKIREVEAPDIIDAVREYNSQRSVINEVEDIPVDLSILEFDEIEVEIRKQAEFKSKGGLEIDNVDPDGDELDFRDETDPEGDNLGHDEESNIDVSLPADNEDLSKKIQTYYQRILFYSFLIEDHVTSLDDITITLQDNNNQRIAMNLNLDRDILELVAKVMDPFKRISLDYKINNISSLSIDETLTPLLRATTSIKKFNRMSESEVITPSEICDDMISLITSTDLKAIIDNGYKIIDIASKSGEFAVAIYHRLRNELDYSHQDIKNSIYSIPTSSIAYEFTRKFYEILDLNVDNIATKFNAYDLIDIDNNENTDYKNTIKILSQDKSFSDLALEENLKDGDAEVKFGAVVGNPPYQEIISKSEGNRSLGKQLFPKFIQLSIELSDRYVSLITPTKWFTANAQDNSFPKLRNYLKGNNHINKMHVIINGSEVFKGLEIGSVNYFLYDKTYVGDVQFTNDIEDTCIDRPLFEEGMDQIIDLNSIVGILNKVKNNPDFESLTNITKGRNAFGLTGKQANEFTIDERESGHYEVRLSYERIRYIDKKYIDKNIELANQWKIFISKANGAAGLLGDEGPVSILGKPYIGSPQTICSDSLIPIGGFETEEEALNLAKYIKTKFLRFMVGILKVSQNTTQIVYRFVPLQNFTSDSDINWKNSIEEIDEQLFDKYELTEEDRDYINNSIKEMD